MDADEEIDDGNIGFDLFSDISWDEVADVMYAMGYLPIDDDYRTGLAIPFGGLRHKRSFIAMLVLSIRTEIWDSSNPRRWPNIPADARRLYIKATNAHLRSKGAASVSLLELNIDVDPHA